MAEATVKQVKEFFHTPERPMTLKEMKTEWMGKDETGQPNTDPKVILTADDKAQILAGLGDGSLTY
jgi:hypothetical protein